MNPRRSPPAGDADAEVAALIETLHETGRRLEELTAGEVDTVSDREGRTFLLRHAQEHLRQTDAAKQAAILNALPARIALVDSHGLIVSVNDAWREFDAPNRVERPGHAVSLDGLEICDRAHEEGSSQAPGAEGIRSVLEGRAKTFSIEYPCHSSTGQRWFLMTVAPLAHDTSRGAVVMHLDVTPQKRTELRVRRMNRVYAVLSGINTLIVRARDRDELLEASCRIAVEQGSFAIAWIGLLDPQTQDVTPVAWAGENAEKIVDVTRSARADTPAGQGSVGQAIRERRPVFVGDTAVHGLGGPRLKEIQRLGLGSHITLPLFENQAVAGTLTLYAKELNYFDEEEVVLLTELAGDISFALDNIAKQQKHDKLARIRAVSSEINAAIVRIRERKTLLKEACRIVSEQGKFEMIWIAAIDHVRQQVQALAWAGFSEKSAHAVSWSSISATKGTIGEAIHSGKPSVRNNVEGELPGGHLRQEALERGCGSSLALPLIVDDKVTALIVLFAPGQGFFDKDELALLNEVASDLSFALQAIEKQEKLDYLAYYDALTGLANRTLFLERVTQYMRSAVSGPHKLALYLIDLERFKNINDTLGQPAGDTLLRQVAELLTRSVGDANLLARVGADHFAVVLPQVKQEEDVARLLEKTIEGVLGHEFRLNDAVFRIAAKVGVTLFPDDGADADTLFRNTEAALKKAKATGERYLFYTQRMTEMVAGRLTLENQLRQALDNEEFVLHYQPKVSLGSGKVTGAEALIRWNDPRTGLVPPGRFIPILEETGMIYAVGRWALRKAVEDYLRWRAAGLAAVRISVNVSPLQLRSRIFVDEVMQALSIDALAAAGLELEITESLIMEDVQHSIASLHALRELGISIAIDDFGTGFSSLSYLAKLPVDTLKIDRSFVVDMTAGPEGLALVSTIINLAHALKLNVVAEGVETEEQSRLLRLLDCDEMQGFLSCKPLPVEIFETRYLAPSPDGNPDALPAVQLEPVTVSPQREARE